MLFMPRLFFAIFLAIPVAHDTQTTTCYFGLLLLFLLQLPALWWALRDPRKREIPALLLLLQLPALWWALRGPRKRESPPRSLWNLSRRELSTLSPVRYKYSLRYETYCRWPSICFRHCEKDWPLITISRETHICLDFLGLGGKINVK